MVVSYDGFGSELTQNVQHSVVSSLACGSWLEDCRILRSLVGNCWNLVPNERPSTVQVSEMIQRVKVALKYSNEALKG